MGSWRVVADPEVTQISEFLCGWRSAPKGSIQSSMSAGMKHIVYKFDDDKSDEMDFDARGDLKFTKGDVISRRGLAWKIESVECQGPENRKQIPTWWVYLTRVFVN